VRIEIANKKHLHEAARVFLKETEGHRIFAFYGQMGSGKTTFIKAVCKELGVTDVITSPTFTLINEYRRNDAPPVFHFDFYRIKNLTEVLDFGIEEYFDSNSFCLMEWPEMIESLLPPSTLRIHITVKPDGSRVLTSDL